ncbi:MAG: WGR domain-containing protein [Deltaproteobacteria bacterium]|nr:WGR domain-containing protein [Deltaproteobacteria bacterium]
MESASMNEAKVRYFELHEGKSQKFWELTWVRDVCSLRYGRIGTWGQLRTETWASIEETKAEANKLMLRKHKKGYVYLPEGATGELPRLKIVCKNRKELLHGGKCNFDLRPFVPIIQSLTKMGALRQNDVEELLNPGPEMVEVDHWAEVCRTCSHCGEYGLAMISFGRAMTLNPNSISALELLLQAMRSLDQIEVVRQLRLHLQLLKKTPAPVSMICEDDVALCYQLYEGVFFYTHWDDDGDLGQAFLRWAQRKHESLHTEWEQAPRRIAELEALIKDEEGAYSLADFINSLPLRLRKQALRGVREAVLSSADRALTSRLNQLIAQMG